MHCKEFMHPEVCKTFGVLGYQCHRFFCRVSYVILRGEGTVYQYGSSCGSVISGKDFNVRYERTLARTGRADDG